LQFSDKMIRISIWPLNFHKMQIFSPQILHYLDENCPTRKRFSDIFLTAPNLGGGRERLPLLFSPTLVTTPLLVMRGLWFAYSAVRRTARGRVSDVVQSSSHRYDRRWWPADRRVIVSVTVAHVEQSLCRQSDRPDRCWRGAHRRRTHQRADPWFTTAHQSAWRLPVARARCCARAAPSRQHSQVHDGPVPAWVRSVPHVQCSRQSATQALLRRNHSTAQSRSTPVTRYT